MPNSPTATRASPVNRHPAQYVSDTRRGNSLPTLAIPLGSECGVERSLPGPDRVPRPTNRPRTSRRLTSRRLSGFFIEETQALHPSDLDRPVAHLVAVLGRADDHRHTLAGVQHTQLEGRRPDDNIIIHGQDKRTLVRATRAGRNPSAAAVPGGRPGSSRRYSIVDYQVGAVVEVLFDPLSQ